MFLRPVFSPKVVALVSFLSYACRAAPAESPAFATCSQDEVATIYWWKTAQYLKVECNKFGPGVITYSYKLKGKCTFYEEDDCEGYLWDTDYLNILHEDKKVPDEKTNKAKSAKCECVDY